jgi:hypothetical protein
MMRITVAGGLFSGLLKPSVRAQQSSLPESPGTNRPDTFARGSAPGEALMASHLVQTNNPEDGPNGQNWHWHGQITDVAQGYPAFPAKYSGPNRLPSGGETRDTVSFDLYGGVRLWPVAEAHQ